MQALLKAAGRKGQESQPKWLTKGFEKQNTFINDTAPLICVQCPRRSGKSFGAGLALVKGAFENPRSVSLYMALTRASAKNILFDNILREINRKFDLGASFNISDLSMTFPNGSKIVLMGVDTDEGQMNKILGGKYLTCVVDEAAFFRINLNSLVYDILKPATMDYGDKGRIILISTTSDITNSLFYRIMHDEEKGWSRHSWSGIDNPFMAKKLEKEIREMVKRNPEIQDTPGFKRMYLNQWAIDTEAKIYKMNGDNVINTLPSSSDDWNYVLGLDLGYNDPTAFVVCAYTDYDPNLYIVETFKKSKMIISDVADKVRELQTRYTFHTMVVDGASKQSVEELKQRYMLPLISAEKSGKRDYIELLNSDLRNNKLLMLESQTWELQDEIANLIWDTRKRAVGLWKEHDSCANHLCDAMLYAWRYCYNYRPDHKDIRIDPTSELAVTRFWDDASEKEQNKKYLEKTDWLEAAFDTEQNDDLWETKW
jgi:hypothetical protein